MKKRLLLFVLLPFCLSVASCDWLDVVPESDITTIDSDFETYAGAETWLKSCYVFLQDPYAKMNNVAFYATDELVSDNYLRNTASYHPEGLDIISGRQGVLSPYDDVWFNRPVYYDGMANYRTDYYTAIVLCNHFINRIDNVYNLDVADKMEWKAEVVALKAFFYFELVRRYGPVIIVPEIVDPNLDVATLKLPRSHVDTCFNYIVRLCDEAIPDLPSLTVKKSERKGYFNKEAAMALKARVLLYQASDLFNGNLDYANFTERDGQPLFSSQADPEKWRRAADAAIAAIEQCRQEGISLTQDYTASTDLQTTMLNIENSIHTYNWISDEVLWMVKVQDNYMGGGIFGYTMPNFNDNSSHSFAGACLVPTMKMVEMYYTENGLPIDQDLRWVGAGNPYALSQETDLNYTDVVALNEPIVNLHRRREARFYADIAADRCYWRLGTTTTSNWLMEVYQGETMGVAATRYNALEPQNITGYFMKKWSSSEGNLYAHYNNLSSLGEQPFPIFRLAELYLIAAEALNEYKAAPDQEVYDYLNVVRKRAGIPNVEVAWKNARDPGKVSTKSGMRDIIRQEWNIEFAFEGYRYWNVRRWKIANTELNERVYGWNVLGNNANAFYNNGNGPIVVYSGNKFVAPRDYLYPIRSEEVQRAGCVQNPGW